MGFNIPRTILTNAGIELNAFGRSVGKRTIIKTMSGGRVGDADEEYLIYTNLIDLKDDICKGAEYTA